MNTVRIYTNIKNVHTENGWVKYDRNRKGVIMGIDMYEIEYIEYDVNSGRIVGTGTEDFSIERYRALTKRYIGIFKKVSKDNPTLYTKYRTEQIIDTVNGKIKAVEHMFYVNKKDNRKVHPLYRNIYSKKYGDNIIIRDFGRVY